MIQLDRYFLDILEEDEDQYTWLSDWEREFLKSIKIQTEKNGGEVTEKQHDKLTNIIEKIEEGEDKITYGDGKDE